MKRTYVTLSIYSSDQEDIDRLCQRCSVDFRRVFKDKIYSAHYTTNGEIDSSEVSIHISHLSEVFRGSEGVGDIRSFDGMRVVIWIYLESSDENFGFDVLSDQVAWFASMQAEIFVDIWGDRGDD